jgi:hypothetical protein
MTAQFGLTCEQELKILLHDEESVTKPAAEVLFVASGTAERSDDDD